MLVTTLKTKLVFIFLSTWRESVHLCWGKVILFFLVLWACNIYSGTSLVAVEFFINEYYAIQLLLKTMLLNHKILWYTSLIT